MFERSKQVIGTWRTRPHAALISYVRGNAPAVEPRWFLWRFLDAATLIAARAPAPLREEVFGRPIGAWLLVAAWAVVPAFLAHAVFTDLKSLGGL